MRHFRQWTIVWGAVRSRTICGRLTRWNVLLKGRLNLGLLGLQLTYIVGMHMWLWRRRGGHSMRLWTIMALECYLCRTSSPGHKVLLGEFHGLLNLRRRRRRRRRARDREWHNRKVALELPLLRRLLVTNS